MSLEAEEFSFEALHQHLGLIQWDKQKENTYIVIGSGVSGLLSASLLLQANPSNKVLVLERSAVSGGSTQTFSKEGFQFAIGLQELGDEVWKGMEAKFGNARVLAQASGNRIEWEVISNPPFVIVIEGKKNFAVSSTWEQTRLDLIDRFPLEKEAIDKYYEAIQLVKNSAKFWMFDRIHRARCSKKRISEHAASFARLSLNASSAGLKNEEDRFAFYAKRTVHAVLSEFTKNLELQYILTFLWGKYSLAPQNASFASHALVAGSFLNGTAYPKGGVNAIEKAIISEIVSRNGKVFLKCPVQTVLLDAHDVCIGVTLSNGKIIYANKVISSIGAANTYERLIPPPMMSHKRISPILRDINELKWSANAVLQVFIGLNGTKQELKISQSSHWIFPNNNDGEFNHSRNVERYFLDKTFSMSFPYVHVSFPSTKEAIGVEKEGCSTCVVYAAAHYDWFKGMKDADTQLVTDLILRRVFKVLFKTFPQLEDKVVFAHLATPLSHEFHLGSKRGAPFGLGHTPIRMQLPWLVPETPIKNLFLGGQDVYVCSVLGACVGGFMASVEASEDVYEKFKSLF